MCIPCGSPLLVVADKHVDERRSDYCNYDRYSRNYHALFPLLLVHFLGGTVAHRKVYDAGCADQRSNYQQYVRNVVQQSFCACHRL